MNGASDGRARHVASLRPIKLIPAATPCRNLMAVFPSTGRDRSVRRAGRRRCPEPRPDGGDGPGVRYSAIVRLGAARHGLSRLFWATHPATLATWTRPGAPPTRERSRLDHTAVTRAPLAGTHTH